MITPACSLFPGEGGWEPEGPAEDRRRWYATALVVVIAVALLLPVALAYHAQVERLRGLPAGGPGQAGPAAPAPDPPAAGRRLPYGTPRSGAARDAPVQLTGTDPLETTFEHAGGLVLVRVAHRGEGPFVLRIDGGTREGEPAPAGAPGSDRPGALVEVAGAYQGSRALGLPAGTYRIGVAAGAQWGMAIERPAHREAARLPREFSGAGDTATRPFEVTTPRAVRMTWTVERDAARTAPEGARLRVRVLDTSGVAVAEAVVADGDRVEHDLEAGRYLLDVTTDAGVWRVLMS